MGIREKFREAIHIELILRHFHILQVKSQEGKFQQRTRAHIVESHFAGEHNPTLVILRLLTKNEKEGCRQIKVFQTRVRVEEKITNLVIDNVSAINLVEKEVIDKIHWPSEELSNPYKVPWANDFVILV